METFNPTDFWFDHDAAAQRQRIVAQDNLRKLVPELFEDVVFLEEYRDGTTDDAA